MIDTKALRQKVLDLAIRGKLVPQDPNDEPASVLLERIRAQKQQMVKDGKLKTKDIKNDTVIFVGEDNLHYEKFADGSVKCIEDEIPFDLPEGWEWCRLALIGTTNIGLTYSPSDICDNGVMVLRSSNIVDGIIDLTDLVRVKTPIRDNQYMFANDILLCARNGSKRLVGKCAILENVNEPVSFGAFMAICRSEFNRFIYYFFNTETFRSTFISDDSKQINQLTQDIIKRTLLPLPPISEQNRIVSRLSVVIPKIASIEGKQEDLQQLISSVKSKILDLAIRGQLVPQDPNDEPASVLLDRIRAEKEVLIKAGKIKRDKKESVIFKGEDNSYYAIVAGIKKPIEEVTGFVLPENWEWITLNDISLITSGKTPSENQLSNDGQIPYFKVSDMNTKGNELFLSKTELYLNEHYHGIIFEKGSFVFPKNGGAVLTNKKRILLQHSLVDLNTGIMTPMKSINSKYAFYMLLSIDFAKLQKGTTIPTVDSKSIGNLIFGLPPISEQERIVHKLEDSFGIIDSIIALT